MFSDCHLDLAHHYRNRNGQSIVSPFFKSVLNEAQNFKNKNVQNGLFLCSMLRNPSMSEVGMTLHIYLPSVIANVQQIHHTN